MNISIGTLIAGGIGLFFAGVLIGVGLMCIISVRKTNHIADQSVQQSILKIENAIKKGDQETFEEEIKKQSFDSMQHIAVSITNIRRK